MTTRPNAARAHRFLRLPDGRAAQVAALLPVVPIADHGSVTVTLIDDGREVDLLVPESWQAMTARALAATIAGRLE